MLPLRYIVPMILILAAQYLFVKNGLNYASPIVFQAIMYVIMAVILSVASGFKYTLSRKVVPFYLGSWLSGVCWLTGLSYVSASESAILSFTMPLFSIPLAVLILRERTTRPEILGAVIGFSGVVLYNIPLFSGSSSVLGIDLTLGNGFFWAMFSVYGRKLSSEDPIRLMATSSVIGLAADASLCVFDFRLDPTLNLGVDLAYQGVLGGAISLFLWLKLLKLEKTSKVTTLTFIAPVITLVIGVALTGVVPAYLSLGGVAVIFAGIYIANILGRENAERPPRAALPSTDAAQRAS